MAGAAYSSLDGEDEHSTDGIPLTARDFLAGNNDLRHPSRSQTYPAVRGASYPSSEPLRPVHAAIPSQSTSYEDSKADAQSQRRRSSVQSWTHRIRAFVNPSLHDLHDPYLIAPDTTRPYIHVRQRWRLWRLTIGEFLMTLALSLAYALLLYGWSRRETIDEWQKRSFNVLSTGLSLLLGLNLAGSLRSYAKLLRWRMLAATYRPLETFDLVLGCDSQINVLRLLWKARNSRYRYLPSRTQMFCVAWLSVNLVMAGIVASIGLTYNLNTSSRFVLLQSGEISVLDIPSLLSDNYLFDLSNLQSWGVRGQALTSVDSFDYADVLLNSYETDGFGHARYWFINLNPDGSQLDVSWRYIDATAMCTSYDVIDGIYGNQTHVIYQNGPVEVNQTFLAPSGPGGLSFATSTNSTCGKRCTDIIVFQAIPLPDDDFTQITTPALFVCQNLLSTVGDITGGVVPPYGKISDELARMLAGAIGWSGIPLPTANSDMEYISYPEASPTGFLADPAESDMADLLADFTIGALAALDSTTDGFQRTLGAGTTPSLAEYLQVNFWRAGALLITIPCVQFVMVCIVIHWANRAIIKDDSHLAAAKLYYSLFARKGLADHGCVLRGEEIVEKMENPMVAYGWVEQGGINHTDVFVQGDGMDTERKFKEGRYDGIGWVDWKDGRSTKGRIVNAREYF